MKWCLSTTDNGNNKENYMNNFTGIGNIGSNPVLRQTDSGRPVTNFNIAIDRKFYRGEGEARVLVSETDWIPIVVWGRLAETVTQYCQKGSKVAVTGGVRPRSYQDAENVTHKTFEVVADSVEFLNRIRSNEQVSAGAASPV
jgi:single-strand DNA-binding protein